MRLGWYRDTEDTAIALELSVNAASSKRLLRPGRIASLHVRLNNPQPLKQEIPIAELLLKLLSKDPDIIPPLSRREVRNEDGKAVCLIHNCRGRPTESFAYSNPPKAPSAKEPREEEVFHSDGSILLPPERLAEFPETVDQLQEIPFQYRVGSRFECFDTRGQIVHRLQSQTVQAAADLFSGFEIARTASALPIRLDQIRLGFETYETRFLGATFGLLPDIRRRLYLEMTGERIYLFIEEEGLKNRDQLPFETSATLRALEEVLEEFELYSGFRHALKAALRN